MYEFAMALCHPRMYSCSMSQLARFLSTGIILRLKEITVREAINSAISEELEKDERVFIIGEDIALYEGPYKVTKGLLKTFGEKRIVDTPITESGFSGVAVGAALAGLKPVCEMMLFSFAMQAMDQIVNSAAKTFYMSGGSLKVPIVFRGVSGPVAGVAAQHSYCLASWFSNISGLKVLAPYSVEDIRGLFKAAIREDDPVVFLENEFLYNFKFPVDEKVMSKDFVLPIGVAKIERNGKDLTLISYSRAVHWCLEAAKELSTKGIDCEVINLRSLKPLDYDTIFQSVKKTHRLITVEEAMPQSGIGSEILAAVGEHETFFELNSPMMRITGCDIPTPYSQNLEQRTNPKTKDIVDAVQKLVKIKIDSKNAGFHV